MSTDTGATAFRRGWRAGTWVKYPTTLPKPASATAEGKARKMRRDAIEDLAAKRELEAELTDW